MDFPAPPRTHDEVAFFVDEAPCEQCGARGLVEEQRAYRRGTTEGRCAGCGVARRFRFTPPTEGPFYGYRLTGEAGPPTQLFDAAQLAAIADRELASVPDPRTVPTLAAYDDARRHLVRARVAWGERAKFSPDDAEVARHAAGLARLYDDYVAAKDDVASRPGAWPKPIGLDGRFEQHRDWLRRGRRGDGQLVMRSESWNGIRLGSPYTHAVLEDSTFTRVDFSSGDFADARIVRSQFPGCSFHSARLERTQLEASRFAGAAFTLADLLDVVVRGGDWQGVAASRSTWQRAVLEDVDLRDATLRDVVIEDCTFTRCDLRDADLSHPETTLTALGRVARTRFVDCDLRGAVVTDTRFDDVTLERCKLHGLTGSLAGAAIVAPIATGDEPPTATPPAASVERASAGAAGSPRTRKARGAAAASRTASKPATAGSRKPGSPANATPKAPIAARKQRSASGKKPARSSGTAKTAERATKRSTTRSTTPSAKRSPTRRT